MRCWFEAGLATAIIIAVSACGSGDGDFMPPEQLATASTLAYVVTECRADADGGTLRQALQIRQGDRAPVTVVEHSAAGFPFATVRCEFGGVDRGGGLDFSRRGVFHRLSVTPDGAQVIFEVTDDDALTVFPEDGLSAAQEGFFAVRADGTGLRRLGPASREPPYDPRGGNALPFLAFSPSGVDRGPSRDDRDAGQLFTLDLATGARR